MASSRPPSVASSRGPQSWQRGHSTSQPPVPFRLLARFLRSTRGVSARVTGQHRSRIPLDQVLKHGIRVVDPNGEELAKYHPRDYLDHVEEHVEPWSYLKFPFLKQKGWQGFTDDVDSGLYRATPLARLNVADGMATPLAQSEYERFFETLTGDKSGKTPVHQTLATHWARVVEMVYAAERTLQLATDDEITSDEIRVLPTETPTEGVGGVEAPRGTLTHHYVTDERGILQQVNLIVGTTNNHGPISMSIKKAAQGIIKSGVEVTEGVLNKIEMAFRAYDPCFGCATHSLPGEMPLVVRVRAPDGTVLAEGGR